MSNVVVSYQPIFLCADDYGQTNAISQAILNLVEKRRINAISCMVNTQAWATVAEPLKAFRKTCFLGLHLNLTLGRPLSKAWRHVYGNVFPRLPRLLRWCYNGRLDHRIVRLEVEAQLSAFYRQTGALPDFIDGHEHVHQFPQIRDALLQMHEKAGLKGFIRTTLNTSAKTSWVGFPKQHCIQLLGGRTFRRLLIKHEIPTNTSFAGIYHFKKVEQYRAYFKDFLNCMLPGGLIMCHPGLTVEDKQDPIGLYRPHEYRYLMSETFLDDLNDLGLRLLEKNESLRTPTLDLPH